MAKDLFEGTDLLASGPRDLFADEPSLKKKVAVGSAEGFSGMGNLADILGSLAAHTVSRIGKSGGDDTIFEKLNERIKSRSEWANPEKIDTGIPGAIAAGVTGLPGMLMAPVSGLGVSKDFLDKGEPLGRSLWAGGVDSALSTAGMAVPILGKTGLGKVASTATINPVQGGLSDLFANAAATKEETKAAYDWANPNRRISELVMGAGFGGAAAAASRTPKGKPAPSKDFSAIVGDEPLAPPVAKPIDVLDARLEHPLAAEARVREQNMKQPSADDYNNRDANARAVEEEIAAMAEAEAAFKAEQDAAESARLNEFSMKAQQDVIDDMPHGERPAQYGMTDTGGRVDENGIPIRADLSMEAQNLQDPLQRNLWGDELPGRSQDGSIGMTQALDKMPESAARDQAISQLSGVPRALESHVQDILSRGPGGRQRGVIDFSAVVSPRVEDLFLKLIKKQPLNSREKSVVSELAKEDNLGFESPQQALHALANDPEGSHPITPGLKRAVTNMSYSPGQRRGGRQRGAIDVQGIHDALRKFRAGILHPKGYLDAFIGTFDSELKHDMSWKYALEESRDPKSRSRVVLMSPADFHKLADARDEGYSRSTSAEEKRDSIRQGLSSEEGLTSMPMLTVDSGKVYRHEGRHRMDVFQEKGVSQVPVIIRDVSVRNEDGPLPYKFLIGQRGGRNAEHYVSMDKITDVYNTPESEYGTFPKDLGPVAADIGNLDQPTDGFRGMGRGQRGALDFGKQLPPSDELTLSKVVRSPDSVTHPISPETIAIKQDLAAKANAINLKDTPYGRVTTLEEAVAGISKDTDINKSYTGIRDKTVSGVETMLRFKPKNRVLNFVRSIFQESRNLHEEWSKEFLTGESGINSALTKLSSQEKVDVVSLLIALDKKQKPLTPEVLEKAGFTETQRAAATRIREAFDFLYQQKGAALGEQGYDPHYYRQGYVPANFSGAYKTLVGHYSKDGSFGITGIAQADTAYGHKKAVEYYKELGGDKFSVFVPIKREGYRTSSALGSAHDSWATLVAQLAKHDPEFAKVKTIADQRGADAAASLYDFHLHEKKKSGVQGSLGDRPWLSPERNAKEFISGMVDYLEEGFRYTAYQKPLNETTKLLTNPKLQEEMPNTAAFVEQYKRHIMGQNLHPVGAGLNWAVDSLAKSLFVGNGKLARVNQELTHWSSVHMMGMLNAGFFAMQLTQLATGGVPELMAIRAQIGGHPETVAKSLTSTITSLSALSAEKVLGKEVDVAPHMREAYDWAHKNGLFTFSEAELAHQVLQSKARKRIDAVATAPIRYGEQATRPAVFMMFTDMFHQNGYTGEQGRLMAQTATDFAMANYHPDERPMLYQSLGVVGSLVGALSTYKHNFVSQHIARAKNVKEIPAAGVAMLGLGFALYGLGGMPGSQELSWLSEKVTGKTLRENLLTEPRKANDWYDGVLTASTGLDFQNRLSNAQVLPDASMSALPHLSNFLTIGQKAYEFAITQDKGSFQDLAVAATPAGMRGITEMGLYPDGNITDKKTGETRYDTQRSTKEQIIRAATGVRPFRERLQDERVYANRKQEAIRQDKLKKAQTNFDRAFLLDDGAGMDKAYEAYIKEDGNPQTLWDSKRLQNLLKEAGKSEEERRAGTPRDINSLRRYEDFTR